MALAVDKEMLARLDAARAQAIEERKGLIDPARDRHLVEAPMRRWGKVVEAKSPIDGQRDEVNAGFISMLMDHQARFLTGLVLNGTLFERFRVQEKSLFERPRSLLELTTSADIPSFVQQVLAFVEPVFERIFIGELVHMRVMQGPQAFVFTLDFKQGSAGNFYSSGTSFSGRLDIDYSDCAAECDPYKKVNLSLAKTTITAICKGLSAEWCLPAEQDYLSQYNRSIADDLRAFMQLQMARERQGEVINELVANAAFSVVWASAIPAGSVYLNLDPKVYASTLYDAILTADNEIFIGADGYRGANWLAGSPDALLRLEKLKSFSFSGRPNGPRTAAGVGQIDEYGNFFGVANLRYNTWKFPFMMANTILLGVKSDAPQELGFIHAEYIPLADLGIWRNPDGGKVVTGMMSRYANAIIRPKLYATVTIT